MGNLPVDLQIHYCGSCTSALPCFALGRWTKSGRSLSGPNFSTQKSKASKLEKELRPPERKSEEPPSKNPPSDVGSISLMNGLLFVSPSGSIHFNSPSGASFANQASSSLKTSAPLENPTSSDSPTT